MKKLLGTAVIFLLLSSLLGGGMYLSKRYFLQRQLKGPDAPETIHLEDVMESKRSIEDLPKVQEEETLSETLPQSLPDALNIEMPFYAQAPHGNWDYPWQEACEEASVLLTVNLYKDMNFTADSFNEELLRLIDWEVDYFGAYEHTTAVQTAEMLRLQYGLETELHTDPSFEDIQEMLNEGHILIAPFAGKLLGNPNFRNGGPVYHMLVIKGYDANKMQIVTNDVGTRNGSNYVYDWEVIDQALHDWDDNDILLGKPTLIEVLPPQ